MEESLSVGGPAVWQEAQAQEEAEGVPGPEQYQLFDTPEYTYPVFVSDFDAPIDMVVVSKTDCRAGRAALR
jgi:hypothetical protein